MRERGIRLAENFLWAGSSALLISIAHLYPQYWFIALFALIPFLWRVGQEPRAPDNGDVRTTRVLTYSLSKPQRDRFANVVILGLMLGTCYAVVAYPAELWLTPKTFLLKLLALNAIFSVYGLLVKSLKSRIGFNVIFIAALWLPLEFVLSHFAGLESLFILSPHNAGSPETGWPVLMRIGSLFGLLMISFIVVLVNTLILIFFRRVVEALRSKVTYSVKILKKAYPPFEEILLIRCWYRFPDVRAPPVNATTL